MEGGSPETGTAKASLYFRFGAESVGEVSSVSGGSAGERIDWIRSWDAIVPVVGSLKGTL